MNKRIAEVTFLIIVISIAGLTAYKVMKQHNDNLLKVSEKYIIERAKKCFLEEKCPDNVVTLRNLYEMGYMERQVNQVTKEYYNEESFVTKEEDNYTFTIKD